jgi:hypothetical protein
MKFIKKLFNLNVDSKPLVKENLPKPDLYKPNLYVDKIISYNNIKLEILKFDEKMMTVKTLATDGNFYYGGFASYLDENKEYTLHLSYDSVHMKIWVFDEKLLKRDTSQVLLAWEEKFGWNLELDS